MGLKILRTHCVEAGNRISNKFFEDKSQIDSEWIVRRTGIKSRFYSNMTTSEMAAAAAFGLEITEDELAKIKLIIVTSVTSDIIIPNIASLLQKKLNITNDCMSLDLNTACSGYASATIVAERMLNRGEYALIVSSEKLSDIINWDDKKSCMLFGDGAAAVLYEKTAGNFAAIGKTYGNDKDLYLDSGSVLHMNGRDVFRFALDKVPKAINEMLTAKGMTLEDIDHVVMHQANTRIIDTVGDMLGISDKITSNIAEHGNTSSASIPILLSQMYDAGKIAQGERLLLVGFGGGLSIFAAVVEA